MAAPNQDSINTPYQQQLEQQNPLQIENKPRPNFR